MDFCCLNDGRRLDRDAGGLCCPLCKRRYEVVDGIPLFIRDDAEDRRVRRAERLLDELWRSMQSASTEEAARAACERHDCTRPAFAADWRFFISAPPEGRTLEIGPGLGDESLDPAVPAERAMLLVPHLTNARILKRHLDERGEGSRPIAVTGDLARLPLEAATIDAAALHDASAPAFGLSSATLPGFAAELRRVVAPGGSVFVGLANPLDRRVLRRVLRLVRSGGSRPTLNRLVQAAGSDPGGPSLGLDRVVRSMRAAGFGEPRLYAPLPDDGKPDVVVPLDDARALHYFLNHLVRRNSLLLRGAVRLADLLVTLGLFRLFVPYYYAVFGPPTAPEPSRRAA